jgi:hypothetical protein
MDAVCGNHHGTSHTGAVWSVAAGAEVGGGAVVVAIEGGEMIAGVDVGGAEAGFGDGEQGGLQKAAMDR